MLHRSTHDTASNPKSPTEKSGNEGCQKSHKSELSLECSKTGETLSFSLMRMLRSVSRLCWMIFLRINWKASTCTAFYIFFRSNNGYPIGRSFVPFIHRNTLQAVERGMSLEEEESNKHLFPILFPSNNCTIEQGSPSAMAYIGDVVFELFARSRYVWPAKRTTDLQHSVVNLVRGMYC